MSKLSAWLTAKLAPSALTSLLLRFPTATAVMAVGAGVMAFRLHVFIHIVGIAWGR